MVRGSNAPSFQQLDKYFSAPGSWTDWRYSSVPVALSINSQISSAITVLRQETSMEGGGCGRSIIANYLNDENINYFIIKAHCFFITSEGSASWAAKCDSWCSQWASGPCLFLVNAICPISELYSLTSRSFSCAWSPQGSFSDEVHPLRRSPGINQVLSSHTGFKSALHTF